MLFPPSAMVINVGINGFGRVGRVVSRVCLENCDLQLSAINDPAISVEYVSYLLKFDSTHGKLKGNISYTKDDVTVDEHCIKVFHEKSPQCVPWHTADVHYVVEASGIFTNLEKASGHFASEGVKRVIVTAPSVDVPMIILGVNENKLRIDQKVLSCASSTLYCLAPIIKVLEDNFGVDEGFITSIHAMTPSLKPLDGLCLRGRHWRDHRSIHQNIIPATTGACKALGKIIPQVKDKLSGLAFRVPIVNVSVLDLTIRLHSDTSLGEIVKCVQKATKDCMRNIIKISNEEAVSSDFMGESHSCIFDEDSSIQLKPNFFKIICWYENEYSYACRVADSILFSETQFCNSAKLKVLPLLEKHDEMLQTDCYRREASVSCCDHSELRSRLLSINSKENKNTVTSRQFTIPAGASFQNYKRTNEGFKIWNDSSAISKPINKKNTGSFLQSCISIGIPLSQEILNENAQARLESVKSEFSKMVNLTDELLKKRHSNQSYVRSVSKNDLKNKNDDQFKSMDTLMVAKETAKQVEKKCTVENCGDCKTVSQSSKEPSQILNDSSNEEEMSFYSFENDLNIGETKHILKANSPKVAKENLNTKKEEMVNDISDKNNEEVGKQHNDFKENLCRTINTLIEGLSQNIQKQYLNSVSHHDNNTNVIDVKEQERTKGKYNNNSELSEGNCTDASEYQAVCTKQVHDFTKTEQLPSTSVMNVNDKLNLIEKYKINKDATAVKLIDKVLKKPNMLVDSPFVAETLSDDNICVNDISVEHVEPKKNNLNQKILEGLTLNPDNLFICSEDITRCSSPENRNITLNYRYENKHIYGRNKELNKDDITVKLIDKVLRKHNIVLVDSPFVAETLSDDNICLNDISVENVEPKKMDLNQKILEGLALNPDNIFICSEEITRCNSPENTNTTLSYRNENKQDIYDKLDSASDSDSNNSCEIKERKSQVIQLTDLTNSFEDLARLDKICRIIEISDELSDSLFSALDNKDLLEIKNKRWSFKDFCERIQLDEFCNKVFGKTIAQVSDS